ncbi:hypothetical protein ACFLTY_04170 [Chloroflexota bacterium]
MGNIAAKSETTALDLLLEKVYRDGGYDFREYKRGTVAMPPQRIPLLKLGLPVF